MHTKYKYLLQPSFFIADIAALFIVYCISSDTWPTNLGFGKNIYHIPLWIVPSLWAGITLILQLYTDRRMKGLRWNLGRINSGFILLAGAILLIVVFGKYNISRITLFLFLSFSWVVLLASGVLRWFLLGAIRARGYNSGFLTFIGKDSEIVMLKKWIASHPEYGYQKTSFIEVKDSAPASSIIGRINALVINLPLDEIVIGSFHNTFPETDRIIDIAEEFGLRVRLIQKFSMRFKAVAPIDVFGPFSVINIRQEPLNNKVNRLYKRGIDVSFSLVVITFLYWWFYLVVGLFIKLSSKGPVVFRQKRVGRAGEQFLCYKFRSMRPNGSDKHGNGKITQVEDNRVTLIGKILRKTNMDELPQFINVLKGEMSLIGPRPHMVEEDEKVAKLLVKYKIRRFVKPGITGWAAVKGYRGGTEDMGLMQERVNHDIYYIENWTPWLDTKIFFITIWKMMTFSTEAH